MRNLFLKRDTQRGAFTLIELLVVLVIIGIVAGFAIPALGPALKGSGLSQGGSMLADQMSSARQYAITHNRTVEVRFYKYADPEIPGEQIANTATWQFRAMQYFERSDTGMWLPVSKVEQLPGGIIMSANANFSTILGEDATTRYKTRAQVGTDANNHVELPRNIKFNYDYAMFHFQPTGATDLKPNGNTGAASAPTGLWHITLHNLGDKPRSETQPPPNYFCWAVDPVTGTGKIYKPSVK